MADADADRSSKRKMADRSFFQKCDEYAPIGCAFRLIVLGTWLLLIIASAFTASSFVIRHAIEDQFGTAPTQTFYIVKKNGALSDGRILSPGWHHLCDIAFATASFAASLIGWFMLRIAGMFDDDGLAVAGRPSDGRRRRK